tara:strand:+ start:51 stop:452 length:402 start_codon:yes stop_codon:yes gene_type:complete
MDHRYDPFGDQKDKERLLIVYAFAIPSLLLPDFFDWQHSLQLVGCLILSIILISLVYWYEAKIKSLATAKLKTTIAVPVLILITINFSPLLDDYFSYSIYRIFVYIVLAGTFWLTIRVIDEKNGDVDNLEMDP